MTFPQNNHRRMEQESRYSLGIEFYKKKINVKTTSYNTLILHPEVYPIIASVSFFVLSINKYIKYFIKCDCLEVHETLTLAMDENTAIIRKLSGIRESLKSEVLFSVKRC